MNDAVDPPAVLVIAPDEAGDAESAGLSGQAAAAGFQAATVAVAEATGWLRQAIANGREPLVVLIGPGVAGAIAVARDIRSVWWTRSMPAVTA